MKEALPIPHKKNKRRRTVLLRIAFFILIGYTITQAATLLARYIGLTSMDYKYIFLYGSAVLIGTIITSIIIRVKKNITKRFSRLIFIMQYVLYLSMYSLWVFRLNEIRIFGLFCALIALTSVLSSTDIHESLLISMGTAIVHVAISYYAIYYEHQHGSFKLELFYSISFLPSFLFISLVARQIIQQHNRLKSANLKLEKMNQDLSRMNEDLCHEKEISEVELELASNIQAALFPEAPESTDIWDVALLFKPRYGVSGDFYDFYYESSRLQGISLFDVTGHGVSSALITIYAKPILYRFFRGGQNKSLPDIMSQANRVLTSELDSVELYISGIMLRFNSPNRVEYVNAGHPDLFLRKAAGGDVSVVEGTGKNFRGSPLNSAGLGRACEPVHFSVEAEDVLLLYTDCLLESGISRNEKGKRKRYGRERVLASLREAPRSSAQKILDFILREFYNTVNHQDIRDDLTIIVVRRTGKESSG